MPSLKEGQKAPDFKLPADDGTTFQLSKQKGKTVVLYFYPRDLTPGCTIEACDFRDSLARVKKKGAVVYGVSRDTIEKHLKFREKHGLNFPLLSDEDGKVCEAYGVWQKKKFMGRSFMGIVRTTFVIDEKGKIKKIFPSVKVAGHADEVLAVL